MARTIERVRAGQVLVGEHIVEEDAEELSNAEINDGWSADDQDWQVVADMRGHADIGQFLLQSYDGTRYWTPMSSWDSYVWRLCSDDGIAVRDEDVVEAWRA